MATGQNFIVGEAIKVVNGSFQDFDGTVAEVKPEQGRVRVLISIFGRAEPIELDFVQVEKAWQTRQLPAEFSLPAGCAERSE